MENVKEELQMKQHQMVFYRGKLFDMYDFGDEEVGNIQVDALPPRKFGNIQIGVFPPRSFFQGFRKAANVL